jgi:hypothetical protein
MYRKSFPEQPPVLLGVGILFGACTLVAFWPLFLALAVVGGICFVGYKVGVGWDRRHIEAQRHRQALAYHADYEHWLLMQGHPAGTFGQWPPAC